MNPPHESQSLWDIVDGILVINLDQRTDRWTEVQAALSGLVPADKLQRVPAVWGKDLAGFGKAPWFRGRKRDATWAARAGCLFSHRKAIRLAKSAGWKTYLILEDDIVPTPAFAEIVARLGSNAPQWDVCYLGYTDPVGPFQAMTDLGSGHQLVRISGGNCTHAYLLRDQASDWILSHMPDETTIWSWLSRHRAIDRWYRRNLGCHFKVAAVSPAIINQSEGYSDITGRKMELAGHHLAVPAGDSGCCHGLRSAMHCLLTRAANFLDTLHGLGKRLRGF